MKIIVASSNEHKLKEISRIFRNHEFIPLRELFEGDIDETGSTFKENAYIKARFIADKFKIPALADDSGLCVDALGGAPGIYSARYSGGNDKDNRALLLKNLENATTRTARFKCVVCLCYPDGEAVFGEGACEGSILLKESGDNGFGYDPLFYSNDLKKSFGDATESEKDGVSHRSRALRDLQCKL